jgi:hypothetical protein
MRLGVTLDILNQKDTPAFYADTLANRPAAGFTGRIFVSTDTLDLYRDTGTTWVLLSPSSTGTITGTGTAGTIPLWSGATTIGNSILTQSGSTIELKATAANDAVLNIDTTTGDFSRIEFQNNGNLRARAYWIESLNQLVYGTYNAGGAIRFETANNVNAVLIDSSQNAIFYGSIGVGTPTPGAAVDVHSAVNIIQQLNQTIATNNSLLAFQNSGTGLWRIGNFYNAGANDFGVFDVVASIQPLTIKKTTGQVLIGTSTIGSGKLVVASSNSDNGIQIVGSNAPSLRIDNAETGPSKRIGLGISTSVNNFIQGSADRDMCIFNGSTTSSPILFGIYDTTNVAEAARISTARNFIVGKTTDSGERLQISGNALFTSTIKAFCPTTANGTGLIVEATAAGAGGSQPGVLFNDNSSVSKYSLYLDVTSNTLNFGNSAGTIYITIKSSGVINLQNVPTSAAGLVSGDIYRTANVLNIVP